MGAQVQQRASGAPGYRSRSWPSADDAAYGNQQPLTCHGSTSEASRDQKPRVRRATLGYVVPPLRGWGVGVEAVTPGMRRETQDALRDPELRCATATR